MKLHQKDISTMHSSGLALPEILIALLLVAGAIIPIFSVFSKSNIGTMMNRDEILAYGFADDAMNFARQQGYDSPFLKAES
ncbi:MAG: hypothetical protein ACOYOS_25125, partial [Syntrophales bacterium]